MSVLSRHDWAIVGAHSRQAGTIAIHPLTGRTIDAPDWPPLLRSPNAHWTLTDTEQITVTGGKDGTLTVAERTWSAHSGPVSTVAIWQHKEKLLVASAAGTALHVWNGRTQDMLWKFHLPAPVRLLQAVANQLVVYAGDEVILFEERTQ
ncbi:hypothetical protein GCM10029964_088110 [Kibdelosporangium lantanae]